jgi:hypothetical protein
MTTVRDTIPENLVPEVEAALAWFNGEQDVTFEVTGILDPETGPAPPEGRDLRLVLCGGDLCEQRSFRVTSLGDRYDVAFLDDAPEASAVGGTQAELDPPPGARRGWLDRALGQHAFVVLVFYRGYW